jgi:hypothetical protein
MHLINPTCQPLNLTLTRAQAIILGITPPTQEEYMLLMALLGFCLKETKIFKDVMPAEQWVMLQSLMEQDEYVLRGN